MIPPLLALVPLLGPPVEHSFTIPMHLAGFPAHTQTIEVPQYPGELESVLICFAPTLETQVFYEHLGQGSKVLTMTGEVICGLVGPDVRVSVGQRDGATRQLPNFDGTADFAGRSGFTSRALVTQTPMEVTPDPDAFEGEGTVTLGYIAQGLHDFTGPGNAMALFHAAAGARVTVLYFPVR